MIKRSVLSLVISVILLGVLACAPFAALTATREPATSPGAEATDTARPSQAGGAEPTGSTDLPLAEIVNDEGGPVVVTGEVTYTNVFFTEGVAQPIIILEDQAGFIDRNEGFVIPVASQTLGQITSDFYTSPFTYRLSLPIEPQGSLRDVDNDSIEEPGVMVFAIAYWNNIWGDPFLQERDLGGGGWSTAYASTRASEEAETEREIIGGKLIVYAPDDQQGFPSGFGADGLLFTGDEPLVRLPQGYTLVDLDTDPFTFDRSRKPKVDLIEPEGTALDDFSGMGYAEAFDAMVDKMSKEYAFTEYKNIDWDALSAEFRPLFEQAERQRDPDAYLLALREFLWQIPDGHVGATVEGSPITFLTPDFREAINGGVGISIREADDGSAFVTFLLAGSPADEAGIEVGAEIESINGRPITQVIDQATPWLGPFSTEHNGRLDKQRFAARFPVGSEVRITYRNPGVPRSVTATMRAVQELDSLLAAWPGVEQTGFELPVEYRLLDSGFAYVKIYSFFDNDVLTIQLWERLMRALNDNSVPGLVIDLRFNGGGRGFLADQMAAYFFQEELVLGNTGRYDESLGEFYFDPDTEEEFILPDEALRYDGDIVAIISPDCASACEFFAYDLTLQNRASLVGYYPTAGLGGGVDEFKMPENVFVRFTVARAVDANGEIHIEGKGVAPTDPIPLTRQNLFSEGDPLLEAALDILER